MSAQSQDGETSEGMTHAMGQADTTRGRDIADYNLDIDYEPEGSEPDIEAVNEEEENSDAE